jgi:hypothetical protein
METNVVIALIAAVLIGWVGYLIYNYKVANIHISNERKAKYWHSRYENVQGCVEDLIDAIHERFPDSTVQYIHNNEDIDRIEGEIKYNIK